MGSLLKSLWICNEIATRRSVDKACALAIFGKISECMFFSRPTHTVKTTTKAINYTIFHPHISIFKGHVSTPTDHPLHFHIYPDKPIECSGAKECVGEYFGDGVDSQIDTSPTRMYTTCSNVSTYYQPQPTYLHDNTHQFTHDLYSLHYGND